MTKEQFKKRIRQYLKIKNEIERVSDVIYDSHLNEAHITTPLGSGYYEGLFLDTITDALDDKQEWVWYWVSECEMGKRMRKITIEGKPFKLKSLDSLWELICMK
jgi:hypothetical protein